MAKLFEIDALIKTLPGIKRGDIIHTGIDKYRNTGKYIWSGTRLVYLDEELDQYGHLPSEFTLNEFPYWDHFSLIDHNNIRWLRLTPSAIIAIYPREKQGKYFIARTEYQGILYEYKILMPTKYLTITDPRDLYIALINNDNFAMKYNNNAISLERASVFFDAAEDEYVIYIASDLYDSY